jgi:hypothetical protein
MYQNPSTPSRPKYAVNCKNSPRRRRPQPPPHPAAPPRRGALRRRAAGDSDHGPEHHLHPPLAAKASRPRRRPPHRQKQSLPPQFLRTAPLWPRFSPRPRPKSPKPAADQAAMRRVLRKRQDKMRSFFDSVAGRLGKDYVPGKSWKSMAEALLRLMPPMVIADLGAGEGASRCSSPSVPKRSSPSTPVPK